MISTPGTSCASLVPAGDAGSRHGRSSPKTNASRGRRTDILDCPRPGRRDSSGLWCESFAPAGASGCLFDHLPRVAFAFGELHPWLQSSAPPGPQLPTVVSARSKLCGIRMNRCHNEARPSGGGLAAQKLLAYARGSFNGPRNRQGSAASSIASRSNFACCSTHASDSANAA